MAAAGRRNEKTGRRAGVSAFSRSAARTAPDFADCAIRRVLVPSEKNTNKTGEWAPDGEV